MRWSIGFRLRPAPDHNRTSARLATSPRRAALAGGLLQGGGAVGALILCSWVQRHRFLGLSLLFVLAAPVVGSIDYAGLASDRAVLATTFCAGFWW